MNESRGVHMITVPTNVFPNYAYLSAENAFLKQACEYRDAVITEQQGKLEATQLDAARWRAFKRIIDSQKGEMNSEQLEKTVDSSQYFGRVYEQSSNPTGDRSDRGFRHDPHGQPVEPQSVNDPSFAHRPTRG